MKCTYAYIDTHSIVHAWVYVRIWAYTDMYFSTYSIHIHCYIPHRHKCTCYCTHTLQLSLLLPLLHPTHNTSSENSLAVCAVQAWDNVPEVFQGQDGCSDIRGKPRRAEADSLHVLHLPPIKKPRALWLSLPVSFSHSLTANYLPTPCLDLISLKKKKKNSLFLSLSLKKNSPPLLSRHASAPN